MKPRVEYVNYFTVASIVAFVVLLSAPHAVLAANSSASTPSTSSTSSGGATHTSGGLQPAADGKGVESTIGPKAEAARKKEVVRTARSRPCSKSVNERADVPRRLETAPIEFNVRESDPVLSFGPDRKTKRDFIVLKASQPIPEGVYSSDFEIDSLEPLRRIGSAELESERLPSPTYSRPHFFNHRKELAMNLCVTPAGGDPGTYTGQLLFAGPGAISSVTLTQTAQLKAGPGSFWPYFVLIVLITIVALALRSYTKLHRSSAKKEIFAEIVVVLGSAGAAALAMILIYEETPTWGEKGIAAVVALITAAFTAAGLGAVISGGSPKLVSALKAIDDTKKERSA
jgi:hypothetical protein